MKVGKICFVVVSLLIAAWVGKATHEARGEKKVETRVFEMRTYYASPGKMTALHERFRTHTNKLFAKHGITQIGYWSPIDSKLAEEKLIYILAYPSKEAADKSWAAFKKESRLDRRQDCNPRRTGKAGRQGRIDLPQADRFLGDQVNFSKTLRSLNKSYLSPYHVQYRSYGETTNVSWWL